MSSGAAGLAGDRGARGPGLASGSLLLFLKHGAGPGAQVVAPGPGFPGGAAATRAAGGERRRGGGVCPSTGGRARQSPVSASPLRWRRAVQSEVGGCPLGRSGRGPRAVRVAGTGRAGAAPRLPLWGAVWRGPGHPHLKRVVLEAPGPGAGLGSEVASRAGCEPARSLQGFPEREEGRRAIEVPGSAGSIRPRGAASPARGGLGRGAGKLCVRSRRHGDERNVSFVLLGSVEVSPGTRRLQIVFVVET